MKCKIQNFRVQQHNHTLDTKHQQKEKKGQGLNRNTICTSTSTESWQSYVQCLLNVFRYLLFRLSWMMPQLPGVSRWNVWKCKPKIICQDSLSVLDSIFLLLLFQQRCPSTRSAAEGYGSRSRGSQRGQSKGWQPQHRLR